jgi:hypothetical protein
MDAQVAWPGVRDRVIAVVGAMCRAYGLSPVLEPVLTAGEIAEVEAQYGVALPGEYRSFLAEVGAGGPGPESGLHLTVLCRIAGKWGWAWTSEDPNPFWILDPRPFLDTQQEWASEQAATLRAAGHEAGARDDEDDYVEDYKKVFGADAGAEGFFVQRGRGAIYISDNGCGTTSWLVVAGPHGGEIRDRECAVNPPFEPAIDAQGNRRTFRTWYLQRLEQLEATAARRDNAPAPL